MGLMIPLMAGLTPDDYDVTLCDERLEDIDFDAGWDLVGMTTTIGASLRAYQLADEFRKKGVPVVFGGFHATLQTEEALKHADAVVQGEADLVWPSVAAGLARRQDQAIYKADKVHDLKNLPRPRHELLKLNRYLFKAVPIQASRGCPYRCSFCEIPVFYERQLSHAPDRRHRRGDQGGHADHRIPPLPVHRRSDHRQAQVRARSCSRRSSR